MEEPKTTEVKKKGCVLLVCTLSGDLLKMFTGATIEEAEEQAVDGNYDDPDLYRWVY